MWGGVLGCEEGDDVKLGVSGTLSDNRGRLTSGS